MPKVDLKIRAAAAMMDKVKECVQDSPIEFANVSDFVRFAIQEELRRRDKLPKREEKN